jgi:hypothetical protein
LSVPVQGVRQSASVCYRQEMYACVCVCVCLCLCACVRLCLCLCVSVHRARVP